MAGKIVPAATPTTSARISTSSSGKPQPANSIIASRVMHLPANTRAWRAIDATRAARHERRTRRHSGERPEPYLSRPLGRTVHHLPRGRASRAARVGLRPLSFPGWVEARRRIRSREDAVSAYRSPRAGSVQSMPSCPDGRRKDHCAVQRQSRSAPAPIATKILITARSRLPATPVMQLRAGNRSGHPPVSITTRPPSRCTERTSSRSATTATRASTSSGQWLTRSVRTATRPIRIKASSRTRIANGATTRMPSSQPYSR